jgi:hypothetical protein
VCELRVSECWKAAGSVAARPGLKSNEAGLLRASPPLSGGKRSLLPAALPSTTQRPGLCQDTCPIFQSRACASIWKRRSGMNSGWSTRRSRAGPRGQGPPAWARNQGDQFTRRRRHVDLNSQTWTDRLPADTRSTAKGASVGARTGRAVQRRAAGRIS